MWKRKEKEGFSKQTDKERAADSIVSTVFILAVALICAISSALLLFVQNVKAIIFVFIFCGVMVGWGIVMISKYFAKDRYREMHDYSFSAGVLCVALGCCGLVRSRDIAKHFNICIAFVVLIIGIVMLQLAVQLRAMFHKFWAVELIQALAFILCSVLILSKAEFILKPVPAFAYWVLLIAAICIILSYPVVFVGFWQRDRRENELKVLATATPMEAIEQLDAHLEVEKTEDEPES